MRETPRRLPFLCCAALFALLVSSMGAIAQTAPAPPEFTHKYSIGFFAEDMPTSSHIILGIARQREMVGVGAAVTWRLSTFHGVELDWLSEVRPLLFESDPTLISFISNRFGYVLYSPAIPVSDPGNLAARANVGVAPYAVMGYSNPKFSRRWTFAGGASPFGLQLSGFKHHRLQPVGMTSGGFIDSTRDIPIEQASYFNFVFQFGGGIAWYRTATQSLLLEFRVQHFSNGHLGTYNPGTDGGLWKLTYRFGKR